MLCPRSPLGLHCQTPVIGLHSPTGSLFIKFLNPPLAVLCLVACWCSDLVNLVVAMELSIDINETHENQDSRKISISKIIFLALENWTVWIGPINSFQCSSVSRGRQLTAVIKLSENGVDYHPQSKSAVCQLDWARGRVSNQTFLSLLWKFWHLFFHPQSRRTPAHVSITCSLGPTSPCVRADTRDVVPRALLCSSRSGAACWQKYWYRILPKNSWKSIADSIGNDTIATLVYCINL